MCLIQNGLYTGITQYVVSKFDFPTFLNHISTHRITFIYVVPPILLQLAKSPLVKSHDLSSLRLLYCGAAPLTPDLIKAVHAATGVPAVNAFGSTECGTVTAGCFPNWEEGMGSVGTPMEATEFKFVSLETGKEVTAGETGELWMKSPATFLGYHNNPEATAASFSEDGFFKTGDVGFVDSKNLLWITDRVKELIKYNGFGIQPTELEGLLLGHEHVQDAAVIGVYDDSAATEVPRAYVVLGEGFEGNGAKAAEIEEWLNKKVAPHKKLRGGVRFLDVIPKSPSGKILKRDLVAMAKKEDEGRSVRAKL